MKRLLQLLALGVAGLVLALAVGACGSDDDDSASTGTDAAAAPGATTAADTSAKSGSGKKIAVLLFSRGFEFMVALDQAAQDEAKKQGLDVTVLDGKGDTSTQLTQIDDQIAAGVDGFVISPNNSEEIVPGIEKINAAGIPVVTVDAISAGGDVAGHVGFDNEAAGHEAADFLIKELPDGGPVLELTGAQGAYHAVRRGRGFDEGMAKDKKFKVIKRDAEWTADKALSLTVDNFTANPDIKAVYSHNDEMVRGVVSGLGQAGKTPGTDVKVVGIDGTPQALERIRSGEQTATIQQDPFEMGSLAVSTLVKAMGGEQVPPEQLLKPLLVTKANVDDPKLWGNVFQG